jgi:spermidine/putrescine transport system permease protein
MQVLALPDTSAPAGRRPGLAGWILLAPMLAWLAAFVIAPTCILVVYSFCRRDDLGRVVYGLTLENYARVFQPIYLRILGRSVGFAGLATALCIVIGYPAAWFIARRGERARERLLLAVMVPFWTSFLIRTYAWIGILKSEGLLNAVLQGMHVIAAPLDLLYTPFAVMIGLVYAYLPFMILPIYGCAEQLDASLIEAAHDLGAGPLRVFREVILPLTWPGVAAGTLLVFVPAIGMFAVTDLMGGARVPLIGNVIQNQFLKARNWPFGSALGVIFTLLFVLAYAAIQGRRERRP